MASCLLSALYLSLLPPHSSLCRAPSSREWLQGASPPRRLRVVPQEARPRVLQRSLARVLQRSLPRVLQDSLPRVLQCSLARVLQCSLARVFLPRVLHWLLQWPREGEQGGRRPRVVQEGARALTVSKLWDNWQPDSIVMGRRSGTRLRVLGWLTTCTWSLRVLGWVTQGPGLGHYMYMVPQGPGSLW